MFEFRPSASVSQTQSVLEILELHQLGQTFQQEVTYREQFEQYCQWYYETAAAHKRELESMRHDVDLFRWFWRR